MRNSLFFFVLLVGLLQPAWAEGGADVDCASGSSTCPVTITVTPATASKRCEPVVPATVTVHRSSSVDTIVTWTLADPAYEFIGGSHGIHFPAHGNFAHVGPFNQRQAYRWKVRKNARVGVTEKHAYEVFVRLKGGAACKPADPVMINTD